ncbi:hypothetical protein MMC28_011285 [Mycoblastus sanguinarius]|nr:hypothetical protein [Mycoblastus sanguinarius]
MGTDCTLQQGGTRDGSFPDEFTTPDLSPATDDEQEEAPATPSISSETVDASPIDEAEASTLISDHESVVPPSPQLSLRRTSTIRRKSTASRHDENQEKTPSASPLAPAKTPIEFDTIEDIISRLSPSQLVELKIAEERQLRKHALSATSRESLSSGSDVEVLTPASTPNGFTRRCSLEDPSRAFFRKFALYGKSKEQWHLENPYPYGVNPEIDQLQLFIFGISHRHFAPATCSLRPGTNLAPQYQCKDPNCDDKWRNESDHK